MLNKKLFSKKALLIIAVLSVAIFAQSSDAFAGHRFTRRIRRPYYHRRVITIPNDYISISISGLRFYYGDSAFHRRHRRRHVTVSPYGCVARPAPVVYIFK